jgi:DNA mismatch repair protein MSH2
VLTKASPGNLQAVEDIIGTGIDQGAVVVAVKVSSKLDQQTIGLCFIDVGMREIGTSEFPDNELFSNLESLVIQLGAKECVIPLDEGQKMPELSKVRDMLDRCGILVTEKKTADFNSRDVEQDLSRLLQPEIKVSTSSQLNQSLAMNSTAALIKYLGLMTDPDGYGKFRLVQHDLNQYMRLDSSAFKALNLLPGPRDGSKTMSLFGLLNKCKTQAGGRLLTQWLKQPLMDVSKIRHRHLLVECMMGDEGLRQRLRDDHLQVVPDLGRLVRKFQKGTANLEDVIRIYQLIIRVPDFISLLNSISDDKFCDAIASTYTLPLTEYLSELEKMQELVETTVDLEALDNHEFVIKPDFDDRLKEIRNDLDELRLRISGEHEKAADDLGMEPEKKLKLEQHQIHGWCMRLTRIDASCLRSHSGYIELATQKAGVYFTSRELQSLNGKYQKLDDEYRKTQASLVREVVGIAGTYDSVLEKLSAVLSHLDIIVSFAHVSSYAPLPYVKPKMHERHTGNTILKEARHPCMEAQDDVSFIPNDVNLVRGESEFLIITGPNMGGKSTYIRQIGVIALMAQVGCFVPCTEAELTIFDSILARVGAGDSQLKGVSTFMAEMLETAAILKSATRESLIVIDELGRGTSTYDGFGLAWAISEHIIKNIGCFAMFATHFHELTALADNHPSVCNLHVVAYVGDDDDDAPSRSSDREITLLYKVEKGISDQSFGINVAEVVKFPQKVINMAKRKARELEDFEESVEAANKLRRFSKEEVQQGTRLMTEILKKWQQSVDLQDGFKSALDKLQALVSGEYSNKISSDAFVRELVNEL